MMKNEALLASLLLCVLVALPLACSAAASHEAEEGPLARSLRASSVKQQIRITRGERGVESERALLVDDDSASEQEDDEGEEEDDTEMGQSMPYNGNSFLETAAYMRMSPECVVLEQLHGQSTVNKFLMATVATQPTLTPKAICTQAHDCKRYLAPLLAVNTAYKKKCKDDCSGNGICNDDGTCSCKPDFIGDACQTPACPFNCSQNGECSQGKCFCHPGFHGDQCDLMEVCPAYHGRTCAGHGTCHRGKCFCDPGFTSENCAEVSVCPNECSNVGFCLYGKCFCPPGTAGEDCSVKVASQVCPNKCSGKGDCKNGRCLCRPGHSGQDCSKVIPCPRDVEDRICGGHGRCHNGVCECDNGFTGAVCDKVVPCPGNGTCNNNGMCLNGQCFCTRGWEGVACERMSPCANGCNLNGVCVEGRCKCLPGFYGVDCSQGSRSKVMLAIMGEKQQTVAANCPYKPDGSINVDHALLNKLMRGGTPCPNACSGVGVCLNGTCACLPPFVGLDCSESQEDIVCPSYCSYRGVCVFGKCRCLPPYAGPDCSESLSPLVKADTCPGSCNGKGECIRGRCVCDPGYAGHDCMLEIPCKDHCSGNGMCDRGRCYCYPGWTGPTCSQQVFCPAGCYNRGRCFYGKCFCDGLYQGEDCGDAPACSKGCSIEHGHCVGVDECVCEPGWTGVACTERIVDVVSADVCPNSCSAPNGTCQFTKSGAACVCKEKWMGSDCSRRVDVCPNDCSGKGVCLLGECKCQTGHTGVDCSKRVGGDSIGAIIGNNLVLEGAAATPGKSAELPRFVSAPHSPDRERDVVAQLPRFRQQLQAQERTELEERLLVRTHADAKQEDAAALAAQHTRSEMGVQVATAARDGLATCPNNCTTHGVCVNGVCFCEASRTGDDCSIVINCPNNCNGHGICKYGQCWCEANYIGNDCAVLAETQKSVPQIWLTLIVSVLMFVVGFIIGRKTLASSVLKNFGELT